MFRHTSGIVSLLSFLLLSIVLVSSLAMAAVEIFEIQVVPPEDPQLLVIYGTEFGPVSPPSLPVVFLGT